MLYEKVARGSVADVAARIRQVAATCSCVVLGDLDLRLKLGEKGVEFDHACRILEVCNPSRAKMILNVNMALSTALPCRISVYEQGGQTHVATIRPTALIGLYDAAQAEPAARDAEETMIRIIDEVCK